MLTEICQCVKNWFEREKLFGEFKIVEGVLTYADGTALPLLDGQYYRIIGSVFNDGVHKADGLNRRDIYGLATDPDGVMLTVRDGIMYLKDDFPLVDEPTFSGAVWTMAPPSDFLALAAEITEWVAENDETVKSIFASESFGGYSYALKGGVDGDLSWQKQFNTRLRAWRKL